MNEATMSRSSLRLAGTGLAALMMAVAAITPSAAQSSDPSAPKAKPKQATTRTASKPARPIPRDALRTAPAQQWTIENALPDHSASMRQYDYVPPQQTFGRVPWQSGPGTVGFETDPKTNPYKTPDGRTIPGLEASDNRSNSYVGLSLSVPTNNNAMNIPVPAPLQPLWGRP
jgi:hypothetical protein